MTPLRLSVAIAGDDKEDKKRKEKETVVKCKIAMYFECAEGRRKEKEREKAEEEKAKRNTVSQSLKLSFGERVG